MALSGKREDHEGFDLPRDLVHYVSRPDRYRRPEGSSLDEFCDELVDELEAKILELGPENVAAFFAEPIMGAGGVIVPPPGYHVRTQEVCRRYQVLYVSDEVVTGFGRLGHMFASEPAFGLQPDVVARGRRAYDDRGRAGNLAVGERSRGELHRHARPGLPSV